MKLKLNASNLFSQSYIHWVWELCALYALLLLLLFFVRFYLKFSVFQEVNRESFATHFYSSVDCCVRSSLVEGFSMTHFLLRSIKRNKCDEINQMNIDFIWRNKFIELRTLNELLRTNALKMMLPFMLFIFSTIIITTRRSYEWGKVKEKIWEISAKTNQNEMWM